MSILLTTIFSTLGLLICIVSMASPKPIYFTPHSINDKTNERIAQVSRVYYENERQKELDLGAGVLGSLPHREIAEQYEASFSDIYGSVSGILG